MIEKKVLIVVGVLVVIMVVFFSLEQEQLWQLWQPLQHLPTPGLADFWTFGLFLSESGFSGLKD